ncbi:tRNA pseudouridine(55) synthase TruB [Cohnella lubricantis]|uniref:tRNA pseudouridine synthase B n=1 Tax=Cohnella lubricantis TaxID=2163172 RepID=A0A841T954_9BACL|nr:tRNA pseudouridine(55) synthase TruB [Cohnella lubricantis]MBB6676545.1 tRNA pseudouridine(55) synthase TruB [Cohnella lubricantis]MBP2117444.1 tRNA pseudouridine55 synthase [Cohnella lubricantis]
MSPQAAAAIEGVLAIWKPAGWTSHDVVAKARRILRIKRIGHTGTLDPAVTGVLPICIGRATRMVEYLQEMPKTYEALLRFGIATDTEDTGGEVIERMDASHLTEEQIREAALSFIGDILQVPPMVSAVKVDGKRLYELARQGVTVERKARPVTIHRIDVERIDASRPHPELRFSVTCSKGTYIRTLCVDIGRKLGVPAVMAELIRTSSAGLTREDSVTLEELEELQKRGETTDKLLAADELLDYLPRTSAEAREAEHALQGKAIPRSALKPAPGESGLWRLYREEDGAFLGLFEPAAGEDTVRPVKVFHPSEQPEG